MTDDCAARQKLGGWWEDQLAGRCTFPIGPVNTWTNIAYLVAGLAAWPHSHVPAVMLMLLGLGSGLYHGFKTVFTDKLDNAGMYLIYGSLAVTVLAPQSPVTPYLAAVVGAVLAWRFAFVPVNDAVEPALLGAFIAVITMAVALHGSPVLALTGTSLMGLGYGCWWKDTKRTFWWPRYGHGAWHVLTALGTYLLIAGVR